MFDQVQVDAAPREPAELAQVTFGGVERAAIRVHAPSTIRFPEVHISPGAHLRFGIGLEDRRIAPYSDGASYHVLIRGEDGTDQEIWAGAIGAGELGIL